MTTTAIVPCVSCGTRNRVPAGRFGDGPRCASCKQPLVPDHPVELTDADFDRYLAGSSLPVVIDFWAAWCGPCQQMAPHFASATTELRGEALLAKLDTERAPATAGRFAIRSIPTMVAFAQGRELARTSGAMTQAQIVAWVRSLRSAQDR